MFIIYVGSCHLKKIVGIHRNCRFLKSLKLENNIHVADKFIEDTYGNFVNFAVR